MRTCMFVCVCVSLDTCSWYFHRMCRRHGAGATKAARSKDPGAIGTESWGTLMHPGCQAEYKVQIGRIVSMAVEASFLHSTGGWQDVGINITLRHATLMRRVEGKQS